MSKVIQCYKCNDPLCGGDVINIIYVAYCLDCDWQLSESEVSTHKCEVSA